MSSGKRRPKVGDIWVQKGMEELDPRRIVMFLIGPHGNERVHWLRCTVDTTDARLGEPIHVEWGVTSMKQWLVGNEFYAHQWDEEDHELFKIRRDRTYWMQFGTTEDGCSDVTYTLNANGFTARAYGKWGFGTPYGKAGLDDYFALKRAAIARGEEIPKPEVCLSRKYRHDNHEGDD